MQVLFVMLDSSIVVIGAMLASSLADWQLMLIVLVPATDGRDHCGCISAGVRQVTLARQPAQRHQCADGRVHCGHAGASGQQCPGRFQDRFPVDQPRPFRMPA